MLRPIKHPKDCFAITVFSILTSCCDEDPGPLQEIRKEYALSILIGWKWEVLSI